MKPTLTESQFTFLLQNAGLSLTEEQRVKLLEAHDLIRSMAKSVRTPRKRSAEPAHIFAWPREERS